jgi:hypothetical protein
MLSASQRPDSTHRLRQDQGNGAQIKSSGLLLVLNVWVRSSTSITLIVGRRRSHLHCGALARLG